MQRADGAKFSMTLKASSIPARCYWCLALLDLGAQLFYERLLAATKASKYASTPTSTFEVSWLTHSVPLSSHP